jgi:hypothetical protein
MKYCNKENENSRTAQKTVAGGQYKDRMRMEIL